MMKSIALYDSTAYCMQDGDYVFVHSDEEGDGHDDKSYDYCDDIEVTVPTDNVCVSFPDFQILQDEISDHVATTSFDLVDETDEGIDSNFSSSEYPMPDLDFVEDDDLDVASIEARVQVLSFDQSMLVPKLSPKPGERSERSESYLKTTQAESGVHIDSTRQKVDWMCSQLPFRTEILPETRKGDDVQTKLLSDKKTNLDLTNASIATTNAVRNQPSRLSNKKRRKQLKTAKKMAASVASLQRVAKIPADAITETNHTRGRSVKKQHAQASPTNRRSSQKVANIAVSCATHSLALYREQVTLQCGKS
ncbi:predicted protein [Phaeodactylum tricornutum CCAP 1055/1]|jgi:hypothetical protein|uniref:Uncharacterized protein n=1 Tax=Phaeodactylum tricornutum (strain CCAP 1055/1) TaxID=556484 RepID=B7FSD6_PHATC|nr:predicted protein [Phaeodactylum tricornutum CCAP 1055/1]EEC50459.1 predicted protein [Phaeodactylum tricornutum CCAP 1055/1]|eukprot:XP_002177645.1 predicted protein [Phaeodactylum tricornutum CCAP 1055/1]